MDGFDEVLEIAIERGQVTTEGISRASDQLRDGLRAYDLQQIRKERLLRQVDVAEVLGVDQSSISQFERGEIGVISVDTLRKYVEALGGHLRITVEFDDSEIPVA